MRQSATQRGSIAVQKNDQARGTKSESRGRPRSVESEDAILTATIQLLSEKSLRDISIEEIAREAGVGKATIYKWWPSKAYVALEAFLRKANRVAPRPDTGSVRNDILEQLRAQLVFYKSPAGHILGQFVAECQIDKEFASLFRRLFLKPRREATGVFFDRGVERGEIDQSLDRELVLDMIYGPLIYRMIVGHAPLESKLADEMISIFFCGLNSPSKGRAEIRRQTARKNGASRGKAKRQYSRTDQ